MRFIAENIRILSRKANLSLSAFGILIFLIIGVAGCSLPADEDVSVLPLLTILSEDPVTESTPGITISATSVSLTEGDTATYTIALNSAPASEVTLTLSTGSQVSTDVSTLTLSTAPETVTVTAVDDASGEGTHTGTVTHTITTTDADYSSLSLDDFTAVITDNDATCKRMFITATTNNGNLGGVAGADAICAADANKPTTATYKALIVDGVNRIASVSANAGDGQVDWVLQPNTIYFRTDCTTQIFTTDANGIFVFGTATNKIGTSTEYYWTGMNTNWTLNGNNCTTWGATGGSGSVGQNNNTNNRIIRRTQRNCTESRNLLCVEQ